MIDKSHIGMKLPAIQWTVEKGRLLAFARAIGETRPEYVDEAAARAAGQPSLLAPPTFVFSGDLDGDVVRTMLEALKVPLERVLHGEQSFSCKQPVYAGDVLTLTSVIADISEKKGGKMEFVTKLTTVNNQRGEHVCDMRSVVVVVNG